MPNPKQYGKFEPGQSIESNGRIALRTDIEMNKFSPFGDVNTTEVTSVLGPKSNYEVSIIRDELIEDGVEVTDPKDSTRVATVDSGEYEMVNPATADASTVHRTARRGRYIPGFAARMGIGLRRPATEKPEGNQVFRWGYFDGIDGFYFGEDANGIFVATKKANETEIKIHQQDWNHDTLDGSGTESFRAERPQNTSGFKLDLSKGHIFQIDYTWYGYGAINFSVITFDEWGQQIKTTVHRRRVEGSTSIRDANLPITYSIENNGTAAEKTLYASGRSYQIIGRYTPDVRQKSWERIAFDVSTTWRPVISIRKKDKFNNVSIANGQYSVISGANLLFHYRINGTLTGANFTTPTFTSAQETALEVDRSATAITGGERSAALATAGGAGNQSAGSASDPEPLELPDNKKVTLCCRTISGTGTATVAMNWVEEW